MTQAGGEEQICHRSFDSGVGLVSLGYSTMADLLNAHLFTPVQLCPTFTTNLLTMCPSSRMPRLPFEQTIDNLNRRICFLTASIILISAASLAVALRLLARRLKKLSLAVDDYLIVVALILAYAMFVALIFCTSVSHQYSGCVTNVRLSPRYPQLP